jgi:hypothetical protein
VFFVFVPGRDDDGDDTDDGDDDAEGLAEDPPNGFSISFPSIDVEMYVLFLSQTHRMRALTSGMAMSCFNVDMHMGTAVRVG